MYYVHMSHCKYNNKRVYINDYSRVYLLNIRYLHKISMAPRLLSSVITTHPLEDHILLLQRLYARVATLSKLTE